MNHLTPVLRYDCYDSWHGMSPASTPDSGSNTVLAALEEVSSNVSVSECALLRLELDDEEVSSELSSELTLEEDEDEEWAMSISESCHLGLRYQD